MFLLPAEEELEINVPVWVFHETMVTGDSGDTLSTTAVEHLKHERRGGCSVNKSRVNGKISCDLTAV